VSLLAALVFIKLFSCFFNELFLGISNLTNVGTPGCQAKTDDKIEDNDVGNQPPVVYSCLLSAVVVHTSPEHELGEEHHSAHKEVKAEKDSWDFLQALGKSGHLEQEKYEDDRPQGENEPHSCL